MFKYYSVDSDVCSCRIILALYICQDRTAYIGWWSGYATRSSDEGRSSQRTSRLETMSRVSRRTATRTVQQYDWISLGQGSDWREMFHEKGACVLDCYAWSQSTMWNESVEFTKPKYRRQIWTLVLWATVLTVKTTASTVDNIFA